MDTTDKLCCWNMNSQNISMESQSGKITAFFEGTTFNVQFFILELTMKS